MERGAYPVPMAVTYQAAQAATPLLERGRYPALMAAEHRAQYELALANNKALDQLIQYMPPEKDPGRYDLLEHKE